MSAEYQYKKSVENMIEALANMNQVVENLNDAKLHAQASNIISDEEKAHRLEGKCARLEVDARNLRSMIGEALDKFNEDADTSS